MTAETTLTTAERLVELCRSNDTLRGLNELYDPDAVSVEAAQTPGSDSTETRGVDGIRGKHEWWNASFEVHSAKVDGPFPHGDDRFAVIFEIDATHKETGQRNAMKEVGIYSVNDSGKIVREDFYYRT